MTRLRNGASQPRGRLIAGFGAAVVALYAVAGIPVFVNPKVDPIQHADAVLVLGGDGYGRYPFGMHLAASGWAPNLVLSNPIGGADPWLTHYCTLPHSEFTLFCFVPDPTTTRGEAAAFRRIAAEHGWKKVIIIASRQHITRARYIFRQCFDGQLVMIESPSEIAPTAWVYIYLYQTAGYLKAALGSGC